MVLREELTETEKIVIENLKRILKVNKMSQKQLARALAMSEASVNQLFTGRMRFKVKHLDKISNLFSISPNKFLIKDMKENEIGKQIKKVLIDIDEIIKNENIFSEEDETRTTAVKLLKESPDIVRRGKLREYITRVKDEKFLRYFCNREKLKPKVTKIIIYYDLGSSKSSGLGKIIQKYSKQDFNLNNYSKKKIIVERRSHFTYHQI